MNYTIKSIARPTSARYTASDMNTGEIAVMREGRFAGHYLLRTYSEFVDLNEPYNTWSISSHCSIPVEKIPAGTIIKLTVTE
jgi:hypothetical protein